MTAPSPRVAIVGGGALGSACALFIRRAMPKSRVLVLERDPSYTYASSARSASSIRQQFSSPVNIALSLFGLSFLRQPDVRDAIGLVEGGYLFLASTEGGAATLTRNVARQRGMGADIRLLSHAELGSMFPWLNANDVTLASYGNAGEGWFDGFSLLRTLRQKAIDAGATFVKADVTQLEERHGRVVGARTGDGSFHECDWAVNCGGPWAAKVASQVGIDLPVCARRRTVLVLQSSEPLPNCPLLVDPCGMWFRGDGGAILPSGQTSSFKVSPTNRFIAGWGPEEANDANDLSLDQPDVAYFEQTLWPQLAHRVPAFESLKVTSAWAGYYEVHPLDHNAIVGPHPTRLPNLLFANGFSGHGLQHAVGIARGIAEWIQHGNYQTIDLSPLHFDRVIKQQPFLEENII